MADKKDEGRLDISVELKDRGVVGSTNLRSVSVLDRLIGAIFGRWTPDLERKPVLTEAVTDGQRRLIEAVVNAGVKDIENKGVSALDAARFLEQLDPKARNLTHVALDAVEELGSEDRNRPRLGTSDSPLIEHHAGSDESAKVDDDWLNFFESYAEKASSDNMRKLWGKILAGEIRKPGAFSLRTLRVASELDMATARQFQELAECRINDWSFLNPLPIVKGHPLSWPQTPEHVNELEAAGLVSMGTGLGTSFKPTVPTQTMAFAVGRLSVVAVLKPGKQLEVPGFKLTRAGAELCKFLPVNERKTIELLAMHAAEDSELITVHDLIVENGELSADDTVKETLVDNRPGSEREG